jgi:hypothetical protein
VPYSSQGSKIYGQGFVFDDADPKANSLSKMRSLVKQAPRLAERILPYIGGDEVNTSPELKPHRHVIYLSDVRDEAELTARWPLLAEIVREKVKPERDRLRDNPSALVLKRRWWAYQAHRPELYEAIRALPRVLVNAQVSTHLAFAFLETGYIYSEKLYVYPLHTFAAFATLQARPHELWARRFSSTLGDALSYTGTDCFDTFPIPPSWETDSALEAVGKAYYDFRAALMVRNNEGMTKTYNHFHDPDERDPEILKLRDLHTAMDRAVLDAYGWSDIPTRCDFLLDYEIDEEEWGDRKKPYRYRWPDEVRDEVLARLLELNAERAKAEARVGETAVPRPARKRATAKRAPKESGSNRLFA